MPPQIPQQRPNQDFSSIASALIPALMGAAGGGFGGAISGLGHGVGAVEQNRLDVQKRNQEAQRQYEQDVRQHEQDAMKQRESQGQLERFKTLNQQADQEMTLHKFEIDKAQREWDQSTRTQEARDQWLARQPKEIQELYAQDPKKAWAAHMKMRLEPVDRAGLVRTLVVSGYTQEEAELLVKQTPTDKLFNLTEMAAKRMAGGTSQKSTLEEARSRFLAGNASAKDLALIHQDKAQYTKDYLSVFQGGPIVLTPKKHANLRRQADVLFKVERLNQNPLPKKITTSAQAVEYLSSFGFDKSQAEEIVKQIMRNDRAPSR